MSTDRELMELAAKAAGMSGGWGEPVVWGGIEVDLSKVWYLDNEKGEIWQPFAHYGDALELAQACEMTVCFGEEFTLVAWKDPEEHMLSHTDCRRAIVMAAAELGRTMP